MIILHIYYGGTIATDLICIHIDLPFLTAHLLLVMSSAPSAQFLARRAAGAAAAASPSPSRPTRSSLLRMSAMENGVRFLSSVIRAEQARIYVQYTDVVVLLQ